MNGKVEIMGISLDICSVEVQRQERSLQRYQFPCGTGLSILVKS